MQLIFNRMVESKNENVYACGRSGALEAEKLHVTSILARRGENAVVDPDLDADAEILAALGYEQEFKR